VFVHASESDSTIMKTVAYYIICSFLYYKTGVFYRVISELVKFGIYQMDLELGSVHFPSRLCWPWGLNKDPTIWIDGARPPPYYKLSS